MFKSCTKRYTDESDERAFRFTFYCDICAKPFSVAPLGFTGCDSKECGELWELRWQKEHSLAFGRANHEAAHRFFCCPSCGEYVCEGCIVSERTASGEPRELCERCGKRKTGRRATHMHMIPPPNTDRRGKG